MREASDELFFFQRQPQMVSDYKYGILFQVQFAYISAFLMDYVKELTIRC